MITIYYGPIINPKTLRHYDALPQCLIAVWHDGNIVWVEDDVKASAVYDVIAVHGCNEGEYNLVDYSKNPGEFIMPGLVDTHVHACQFPLLGVGGDYELLDWLFEYVFPVEAKFGDHEYAQRAYNDVIHRSIASGTTTSCYYSSLHLDTTIILANIIHKKGQRAFVGKCNMDWNCPGYYIERTPEDSLEDTKKLIRYIMGLPHSPANEPLVHPIITPRFALSCSNKLLTELGKLAAQLPQVSIQTHISENRKEVEEAMRRFNTKSYAAVYDKFGLLRNNTILAHGVWLTETEMKLIAERKAGVVHCPTSNFYLGSGMAKVGLLLDHGVKVGLGTDVSGGYNPSILHTVQMASTTSKMVAVQAQLDEERRQQRRACRCCNHCKCCKCGRCGKQDTCSDLDQRFEAELVHGPNHHEEHHHQSQLYHSNPPFTNQKLQTETLLYLATLGGADVCCLRDRIGSFEVGKAFDALHVSLDDACGNPAVWGAGIDDKEKERTPKNLRTWLERFMFTGDNRNIRKVWVQGLVIGGTDKHVRSCTEREENEGCGLTSGCMVRGGEIG